MAWAVVQSKRTSIGTAGNTSLALGNLGTNPIVGNRIIVVTEQWAGGSVGTPTATVADTPNGSYTKHLSAAITDGSFNGEIAIHSVVCTSNTATNPTATYGSSPTASGAIVAALEVSGLNTTNGVGAVDVQTSTGGSAGGTASSGATSATAGASEFALMLYGDDGWAVSMSTGQQEATWTWLDGLSGGSTGSYLIAYKDSGSAGSTVNGQMASGVPGGSATWAVAVAVFLLPAVAGLPPGLGPEVGITEPVMQAAQAAMMR